MYDIDFESKSGGRFWRAVFQIRSDSNTSGGGDAADLPVGGATIEVTFAGNTYTGTTGSDGIFRTGYIKGLDSGDYLADVDTLSIP